MRQRLRLCRLHEFFACRCVRSSKKIIAAPLFGGFGRAGGYKIVPKNRRLHEIYNADGSRAELCGNALRCVAKYCFERKKFSGNIIGIETDCGEKIVEKIVRDKKTYYSAKIGQAKFANDRDGKTIVSLGNPHRTEKTDDVRSSDFFSLKNFRPDLYNTEIFSVTGKNSASARVFERGSGETLSCGSGACAIAAFGVYSGYFSLGEITVKYPGGTLYVNVDKNYLCTLTGEANFVFDGEVRL